MPPKESGGNKKQVLPQESKDNGDEHVREHSGVKRAREGSQEPTPSPNPSILATKKNRLGLQSTAEGSSEVLDVEDVIPDSGSKESTSSTTSNKERETRNVGEVRKKVEEMTWKEGQPKPLGEGWEEINDDEVKEAKVNAIADAGGKEVEAEVSSSVEKEKGDLKRKVLERNESSVMLEEPAKKAKETPSPPASASVETTELPPATESASASAPASAPAPTSAPAAKKPQSTFSAFSSSASPFSAARTASPFASAAASASGSGSKPLGSAFGNYSASSSPFARKPATTEVKGDVKDQAAATEAGPSTPTTATTIPHPSDKKDDGPAPKASTSFGDILKESKADAEDTGDKVQMTEKDVHTGEEEEETIYQTRAKLYVMQTDGGWKERGVGTLRLNVRASDGKGARLVMRAEGVLRLILNVSLYVGMTVLEDGKHVRSTVFEDKERRLVTFRLGTQKAASELCANIQDYIPLESTTKSPAPAAPSPAAVTA